LLVVECPESRNLAAVRAQHPAFVADLTAGGAQHCPPRRGPAARQVSSLYTVVESLTRDGRDRSLDHKLSASWFPGAWEGQ